MGADPDGAVWRPAAISASGTAGVGGHPVQSPVYSRPVYGLSAGYEGRPHGDLAVGYVLAGLARALGHSAAAVGEASQGMPQRRRGIGVDLRIRS